MSSIKILMVNSKEGKDLWVVINLTDGISQFKYKIYN